MSIDTPVCELRAAAPTRRQEPPRRGPVDAAFMFSDLEPAMQTGLRDPEVLRDLAQRRLTLAGHGDDMGAELGD